MARGKVITTHLRTGDPNGIRTVFISNKICEMIVFPKSEFEMVSKMEESSRPAQGVAARLCAGQPQHRCQLLFRPQLQRLATLDKRRRPVAG